ncbi:Hypothetical protein R9X50_00211300 [Acrodontium crateriforme]|uniref:Histone-lysine N-methyltransferase, H3 lysine-79 specific n=1 Tax=Acrodontium crateriforme TaxID=150365 RepID=A0AAQ3R392_9PEZI|nr:Hypothetical protein R9X50_00211300 [Acrodontium crateriforme]
MNFTKPTKKVVIRREIVQIKPASTALSGRPAVRPGAASRYKLTPTTKSHSTPSSSPAPKKTSPKKTVEKRAIANSRGTKRASDSPVFSSDEEDSSDVGGSDSDASRKRIKSSVSSLDSHGGPRRIIFSKKAFEGGTAKLSFIHGADAIAGKQASKYENPWGLAETTTIELQYPSRSQRERFALKWPKGDRDEYKPFDDLVHTIDTIATFYFPEKLSSEYTDEANGFFRRLNRAFQHKSVSEWVSLIEEFNKILKPLVEDGSIQRELRGQAKLHLNWVKRILDQIFSRTVSPKAEVLNSYKIGGDNVYGELLPRFVSDIFTHTKLNHEQMFIDLGSGVGNVVLQAALEVGCESWGIEMMKNPCDLAELQAAEFNARARLWGLDVGTVKLLRGDMTAHEKIPGILQRADVVLVNNQAFTPELNDKLINMFLDLKEGAKVVSLKPFVPLSHKMAMRNIDSVVNQFVQIQREYFSDSVSWSHSGNQHWYIATKDTRPLKIFRRKMGLDTA